MEERTAEWIPCGGGFIAADVIRWTETVWRERKRGPVNTGEWVVVAEVLGLDGDWVDLLVRDCRVAAEIARFGDGEHSDRFIVDARIGPS